jgi:SET domain-containing protein
MNHSCDPNLAIDVSRRLIVARRPIAAGEELCFDYHTTEWELHEPFICRCTGPHCVGLVRGFAHLPPARQQVLLGDAAPHIHALHAARTARRLSRPAIGASLGIETTMPPPPLSAG